MREPQEYIQMMLPFSSHMSVLYVEDDDELRNNMEDLLGNIFESVTTTCDGIEALRLLSQTNYDILITDINMPRMNGIELIKEVKVKNPNQTIVVLSAYNQPNYLTPLIKMGISNYLMKPFDLQRFAMTLLRCVLLCEENKNKTEKERIIKEELYSLREENKKLKKLLEEHNIEEKETIQKGVLTPQKEEIPLDDTPEKLIEILGIDPVASAQKIDELVESIEFLSNRIKEDTNQHDIISVGDLYFELSKEFALLGSLNKYSEHFKELAFGLYDPNINFENIEKIKNTFFIINDHIKIWINQVLLEKKASTTSYTKEELSHDVANVLELCKQEQ